MRVYPLLPWESEEARRLLQSSHSFTRAPTDELRSGERGSVRLSRFEVNLTPKKQVQSALKASYVTSAMHAWNASHFLFS